MGAGLERACREARNRNIEEYKRRKRMTNDEIKTYIGKAIYHIDEATSALSGIEGLDATIQNLWDVSTLLEFAYEEHDSK